ncbi:MAG: 23S rRNA (adenine(2030)-N(6))-methyltransferase RlmJ, partial [Oxalobacter sp.]
MFSYRHIFHAGNHADVFKHIVLHQTLLYFRQKDTPFYYIDTHAGAGVYVLDSGQAKKSGEAKDGIFRLLEAGSLSQAVTDYLQLVKAINPGGKLVTYPGSPYIAELLLRGQDRLRLFEMHSTDIQVLEENVRLWSGIKGFPRPERGKRIIVTKKDGFSSLKSLLPPPSRRAVVLIDPSYEVKQDYLRVVETLSDALKRFQTGTYLIWYPVLQRMESRRLSGQLKKISNREWLHLTFRIASPVPDG